MNKVILVGRLTKNPELRATANGIPTCSFTVACDRQYAKQGEERQADFINCVAWRQNAEFVPKYFAKGHRIALEGSIQTRSWEDSNGQKRYTTEVLVDRVEFVQSKSEVVGNHSQVQTPSDDGDIDGFVPIEDDDLPF